MKTNGTNMYHCTEILYQTQDKYTTHKTVIFGDKN